MYFSYNVFSSRLGIKMINNMENYNRLIMKLICIVLISFSWTVQASVSHRIPFEDNQETVSNVSAKKKKQRFTKNIKHKQQKKYNTTKKASTGSHIIILIILIIAVLATLILSIIFNITWLWVGTIFMFGVFLGYFLPLLAIGVF